MNKYFQKIILAKPKHIDQYNHVNNEVYITWIMKVAREHSNSLGLNFKRYKELGGGFFVKRHEINYEAQAHLGDELIVRTWPGEMQTAKAYRHYKILNFKTQKTIIKAMTVWAYIDLKTGRPIRIHPEIKEIFANLKNNLNELNQNEGR